MASSLARTALCAFSATPSSIFPQKILHSCPLPALPFPACRKDTPGYRHPLCRFPAVCGLKTTPLPAERAVSAGDKHRKPEKTFPSSPSRSCQGSTAKQGNPYRARCSAPPLLAITALVKSCQRKRERTRETRQPRRCLTGLRIDKKGDPFPGNRPAKDPLLSAQQVSILRGLPEPSSSFPRPGPKSPRAGTSACRALPSCRGTPPPSWG